MKLEMRMEERKLSFAWSARCNCYKGHRSNSGRCETRYDRGDGKADKDTSGVTDPTRSAGEAARCMRCREECK